ncbi:MAG: hypothetical protein CHACPFDD_03618 [Phycisphaerae bacterium]|nr:hypothetical protein [Phycisphaerae bacterium]
MSIEPLETAHGGTYPLCRQISVFLDNRVGQLLRLTRLLDGTEIRILALMVEGAIDCAIVRLLVDQVDSARELLSDSGFAVVESEILVVALPPGNRAILTICQALISGEVNIHYTYPLLVHAESTPMLAIKVDDATLAASVLAGRKFRVFDHTELS